MTADRISDEVTTSVAWYIAARPGEEPAAHLGRVTQGRIQTRCDVSLARSEARPVDGDGQPDGACAWCLTGQPHPSLGQESRPRHRLHRRPGAALARTYAAVTVIAVLAGVAAVALAVIGLAMPWVLR